MLCLLMCVSVLASCDSLSEEEKGANVRVYLTDYPYTLDPAVVQLNSDVEQILSMIFEPLTTIDEDGEVHQVQYSPYEGSLYGIPGRGKTGSVTFDIGNNVEMKWRTKSDS